KYLTLMMWQDEARFFPIFARAAGFEDLLDDSRYATSEKRAEHLADLIAEIQRRFRDHPCEEWVRRLSGSECIWGRNQSPIEIPDDPQVRANGYILDIPRDDGTTFRAIGSPIVFDGEAPVARHAAQTLGQATEEVLLESGASPEELRGAAAAEAIRRD
ncbi:MAG: CoA transferase, partial [bacterium]